MRKRIVLLVVALGLASVGRDPRPGVGVAKGEDPAPPAAPGSATPAAVGSAGVFSSAEAGFSVTFPGEHVLKDLTHHPPDKATMRSVRWRDPKAPDRSFVVIWRDIGRTAGARIGIDKILDIESSDVQNALAKYLDSPIKSPIDKRVDGKRSFREFEVIEPDKRLEIKGQKTHVWGHRLGVRVYLHGARLYRVCTEEPYSKEEPGPSTQYAAFFSSFKLLDEAAMKRLDDD